MKIEIDNPQEQIKDRKADKSGRIAIGRREYGGKKVRVAILEVLEDDDS